MPTDPRGWWRLTQLGAKIVADYYTGIRLDRPPSVRFASVSTLDFVGSLLAILGEVTLPSVSSMSLSGTVITPPPVDNELAKWLWSTPLGNDRVLDELAVGTPRPIQPGRARDFDGVDDYVLTPNLINDNGSALSVCVWAKYTVDGSNAQNVCSNWRSTDSLQSWQMHWLASGTAIQIRISSDGSTVGKAYTSDVSTVSGDWAHFAFTFANDDLRLFVDGVEVTTFKNVDNVTAAIFASGVGVSVGANKVSTPSLDETFAGPIRDVRIWNRTLAPAELADIYTRTVNPGNNPELAMYPTNLLCHLHLEEGSGSSCPDASGNGNNGTAFGISEPAFNYESNDVPSSFQNEIGFSGSAAPYVPANSTDVTTDPSGGVLEFQGVVPKDALLVNSTAPFFDGIDDSFTALTATVTAYPFSICAWVFIRSDGALNRGDIFEVHESTDVYRYALFSRTAGTLRISRSNINGSQLEFDSTLILSQDRWEHLTISFTGDNAVSVFLDGVRDDVIPPAPLATSGNDLTLFTNGKRSIFRDRMLDLRLYDDELDETDIANIMANQPVAKTLVSQHPFIEGSGTAGFDVSGNGNHGTFNAITEGSFWAKDNSKMHGNIKRGFTNNAGVLVPALADGTADAEGNAIGSPAGIWHNNAETQFDFTQGEPNAPWTRVHTPPTAYAHGDALPANWAKRIAGNNEDNFQADKP